LITYVGCRHQRVGQHGDVVVSVEPPDQQHAQRHVHQEGHHHVGFATGREGGGGRERARETERERERETERERERETGRERERETERETERESVVHQMRIIQTA